MRRGTYPSRRRQDRRAKGTSSPRRGPGRAAGRTCLWEGLRCTLLVCSCWASFIAGYGTRSCTCRRERGARRRVRAARAGWAAMRLRGSRPNTVGVRQMASCSTVGVRHISIYGGDSVTSTCDGRRVWLWSAGEVARCGWDARSCAYACTQSCERSIIQ